MGTTHVGNEARLGGQGLEPHDAAGANRNSLDHWSTQVSRPNAMLITKTKFLAGTQCLKRLYFTVHAPELAVQPDESSQSIIEQGREVGLLAREIFPGGVAVECRDREEAVRATRNLIDNPEVPAIFEGAWEHRNVFVRVD